jgi:nifR3 family TIM-barrel protein
MKLPLKPLKIGKIAIRSPIILAPMVDITDLPYRLVCRKAGCQLAYTEMIYIDAIIHENQKTQKLMQTNKTDSPLGIQITGNNLEHFKQAIPILKKYDFVDLNCGCPSERLIKSQAGSFLLNSPKLIHDIISLLKSNGLTVTAKIRLGFKKNNVLEVLKAIESAGADAITVHPRLAIHGYNEKADWQQIKLVKQNTKLPVIANGDILDEDSALSCLQQTGCDAIMVARGAIGDPLIFKRINNYLKTGRKLQVSIKENIKYLNLYLSLCKKYDFTDLSRIKRISCKFIKGFPGSSKIRNDIMLAQSLNEIKNIINKVNID